MIWSSVQIQSTESSSPFQAIRSRSYGRFYCFLSRFTLLNSTTWTVILSMTTWGCAMTHSSASSKHWLALRYGGIADALQDQDYPTVLKWEFLLRILFNLSFFMIVIILLLQVIFDVIIDSFGELRPEESLKTTRRTFVLFVVSEERITRERLISILTFKMSTIWRTTCIS